MKPVILVPIIIGAALLVTGGVVVAIGLANSSNFETVANEYTIEEAFENFDIDLSTANLEFKVQDNTTKKVVCVESTKQHHDVKVTNNALTIKQVDERKWYEKLFSPWNMKVTVYLPSATYGDLKIESSTGRVDIPADYTFNSLNMSLSTGNVNIKSNVTNTTSIEASTGDISLSDITTNELKVKASTGDVSVNNVQVATSSTIQTSTGRVSLNNVASKNLNIKVSTGYVKLTNTVIEEHMEIKASTGTVKITDSDAATIKIETSTGDVDATLLTSKIVYAESDTSTPDVPKSTEGGLCEIKTDTGRIKVRFK